MADLIFHGPTSKGLVVGGGLSREFILGENRKPQIILGDKAGPQLVLKSTTQKLVIGDNNGLELVLKPESGIDLTIGVPAPPVGGGESNDLVDAGSGTHESLVASPAKIGTGLQLKGLRAGDGISLLTNVPDDVVVIASREKIDVELSGAKNGINLVYTTPEFFLPNSIRVYVNGVRQEKGATCDFTVSESGGVGTGYDTVTLASDMALLSWEKIRADYLAA